MSQARKRERFFADHPTCCFCGGETPATTVDHIPSRNHFSERIAPEGYEFPACANCQTATANLEQLIAFIGKVSTAQPTPDERIKFQARSRAVRNNFLKIFESMLYTASQKKRLVREKGIQLPLGMLAGEAPLLNLNHPDLLAAVETYARKLLLALHYHHTRSILRHSGAILYAWYTNVHQMRNEVSLDAVEGLRGIPIIKRQAIGLGEQFSYRFGVEPTSGMSAFFVTLGESIAIMGTAMPQPELHDIPPAKVVLRPFDWTDARIH